MSQARPAAEAVEVLAHGDLTVSGRIMPASNATFYGEVSADGVVLPCVYKPIRGERPLWDFPDGTLAGREYAAWLVSESLGWEVVPPTLLRDGPVGRGMVQLWQDVDEEQSPVDIVPTDRVPEGFLHVFDGLDSEDRPVSLVHEDTVVLRRMAFFDVLVNNADRKGGHVLAMTGGHRYGVDHGVSFHVEPKLRTVLWGWLGAPLTAEEIEALARLEEALAGSLRGALEKVISAVEVDALGARCRALADTAVMPQPSGEWPAIPWPPF